MGAITGQIVSRTEGFIMFQWSWKEKDKKWKNWRREEEWPGWLNFDSSILRSIRKQGEPFAPTTLWQVCMFHKCVRLTFLSTVCLHIISWLLFWEIYFLLFLALWQSTLRTESRKASDSQCCWPLPTVNTRISASGFNFVLTCLSYASPFHQIALSLDWVCEYASLLLMEVFVIR